MNKFKKVTKEEFEKFIENYPRPLERNFFMDWLDFYDFPNDIQPKSLEELYSYKVARIFRCGYEDDEFFIEAEREEE